MKTLSRSRTTAYRSSTVSSPNRDHCQAISFAGEVRLDGKADASLILDNPCPALSRCTRLHPDNITCTETRSLSSPLALSRPRHALPKQSRLLDLQASPPSLVRGRLR